MKCFLKAAFSPPRAATCVWFSSSHSFAPRFPSQDILGLIQESQQLLKVTLALSVFILQGIFSFLERDGIKIARIQSQGQARQCNLVLSC